METTPHHRDGGAMEKIHEEVTLEAKEYSGGITGNEESLEHTTPMETTPHHRDGGAMEKIHEEVTLEAKEYSGGITGKYTINVVVKSSFF
ncbi:hypothetical protein ROHU_009716 [Labeo rohita]|uniref:Uncharacterized protein n=1 Tax=Labeo rohita TaxID=84645 RepID=A0A498M1S9_LABRO|nr:hypothetical protein ROHU_009716 [Labeo rohita]